MASLLLMDVTGAYDHVSHNRLSHNLQKRRINVKYVTWILNCLIVSGIGLPHLQWGPTLEKELRQLRGSLKDP